MSTTATTSELLLADLGCAPFARQREARVLIGGLGLGFTLKRTLEIVGRDAAVHVAELMSEVVAWNRGFLREVNGALLDDSRVSIFAEDVFEVIKRGASAPYDAILLDVDNGPTSFVQKKNVRLYDRHGFIAINRALKPGGRVAYWSATEERGFIAQLSRAGFIGTAHEAKAHEHAKRAAHRIYVAERRPPGEPGPPAASTGAKPKPGPKQRRAEKGRRR
jgi:spermidine synthase